VHEPLPITVHEANLPDTRLRYAACGDGPPLIIVPATVSLIEDWTPMVQFLAGRYRTYFFELPGHGGSTPLEGGFSSHKLAKVVGELADHLGHDRFTLLGFSFGGILTIRTLQLLGDRVEQVALLSPCVSNRGLLRPPVDRAMIATVIATLKRRLPRRWLAWVLGNELAVRAVVWFMRDIGGFETTSDLRGRLSAFSESSLEVLVTQVHEILTVTEEDLAGPYDVPCWFGMSVNDPLLDYARSERFAKENFPDLEIERFQWPYHAPPEPLTYADYCRDFTHMRDVRVSLGTGSGI
jgi:pimeloyl-ACP methyl ester carboxylesterase